MPSEICFAVTLPPVSSSIFWAWRTSMPPPSRHLRTAA
nr:MAG TPA: hypothetical protein [Caudoviricetes sp.]